MVRITAREPLETFADKIAERTGMTRQNVVHVLTSAMIVATEQVRTDPLAIDGLRADLSRSGHGEPAGHGETSGHGEAAPGARCAAVAAE